MKILKLLTGSVAAVALVSGSALAQEVKVLTDSQGVPVRDSQGQCVLTSGIPHPDCQPKKDAPAPKPSAPATPTAPPAPPPPAPPPPPPPPPPSVRQAIVIQADALFDFDKSVVRKDGMKNIDEALAKLAGVDVEMVIATGHTDSVGTDAYNVKLSDRRAAAVKAYLVSKGIAASKITTLGKGESQPVATNKTKEGRQKNRRVDIEFKGVKK